MEGDLATSNQRRPVLLIAQLRMTLNKLWPDQVIGCHERALPET